MTGNSVQGSVMQGDGRRATAETVGKNRPLVNELHCTYTFPLRSALIATTRKNRYTRTMLAVHTLVADEEEIDGFASLHRVGLAQHGKIHSVDYGLELTIV
jgi:hypothetical protein